MTGEFSVAVHALVYLNHMQRPLTSDALAENVCTHPARIRKVMAKLKKAELVSTREGADGGYTCLGDPHKINLAQILTALNTPVVELTWRSGNLDMECLVASGMANIMDHICEELDDTCKQKLAEISIADIDAQIFRPKSQNI